MHETPKRKIGHLPNWIIWAGGFEYTVPVSVEECVRRVEHLAQTYEDPPLSHIIYKVPSKHHETLQIDSTHYRSLIEFKQANDRHSSGVVFVLIYFNALNSEKTRIYGKTGISGRRYLLEAIVYVVFSRISVGVAGLISISYGDIFKVLGAFFTMLVISWAFSSLSYALFWREYPIRLLKKTFAGQEVWS